MLVLGPLTEPEPVGCDAVDINRETSSPDSCEFSRFERDEVIEGAGEPRLLRASSSALTLLTRAGAPAF